MIRRGRRAGPARAVRVEARAKLNLGLAVGARRPDGFHELVTVFQSVSLSDTLIVRRTPRRFSLRIAFEDASVRRAGRRPVANVPSRAQVEPGRANLVLRAARLAAARWSLPGGADFLLVKRIPTRAGLGGGSADAAAALAALQRLHGLRRPRAERLALAAELGSDVPFALRGGSALARGRGERLVPLRLRAPFRALVAVPRWGVSTPAAYRRIDRAKYALTGWATKLRIAQRLECEGLRIEEALRLGNTFEGVLGDRTRDFEVLRARLEACGAENPRMTGSGSAVFGILPTGASLRHAIARFDGAERLYAVRSVASALRVTTIRQAELEAGMQNARPGSPEGSRRFVAPRTRSRRGGRP